MCLDLFLYACKHVPRLFRLVVFSKSSLSSSVFYEWVRLSSVLVLYGTYRAHDERMKPIVRAEISQIEWPDRCRVRPSHFHCCKLVFLKAGVAARWLSGSVRVPIYLLRGVLSIGRAYIGLLDGENVK